MKLTNRLTYLILIKTHKPVHHVVKQMKSIFLFFWHRWMRPVYSWYAFVLPPSAEGVLIVKKTQLFDDIVHYQVSVYLGLVGDVLLVGFAELVHLINIKALIRVNFKHAYDKAAQFLTVSFRRWRKFSLWYALKQLVEIKILLVWWSERTSKSTQFISNATHTPHIWLPVVPFALQHFRTHVKRSSNSRKCFESLRT